MKKNQRYLLVETGLLSVFMGIFGLFIHSPFPLNIFSIAGLVFVCLIIACRLIKNAHKSITFLIAFFGIKPLTRQAVMYTFLCMISGFIMAAALRTWNKAPLIPGSITLFAAGIAPLIGISEELLFRGYIQNRLYEVNSHLAVILAALFHTMYKCSLMVFPPLFEKANIPYFAFWTFAGGLLFGLFSWKSHTVYPALAGHALFDIIVYSASETAPWWVW